MANATNVYINGDYGLKHQDWHLVDAPGKAEDLMPGLLAAIESSGSNTFRLADIGTGVGGVLLEVVKQLNQVHKNLNVESVGFEISPLAVETGRKLFPNLNIRQKFFESSDGPFDAVMFVDVLEHLENPWEMLRTARNSSKYMIVRQPLLESFSTFRHNNYRDQREHWGHIGYFNYYSFMDMVEATGWKPLKVDLLASWELAGNKGQRVSPIYRLFVRANRLMASHFLSGFYLNGVFKRI